MEDFRCSNVSQLLVLTDGRVPAGQRQRPSTQVDPPLHTSRGPAFNKKKGSNLKLKIIIKKPHWAPGAAVICSFSISSFCTSGTEFDAEEIVSEANVSSGLI